MQYKTETITDHVSHGKKFNSDALETAFSSELAKSTNTEMMNINVGYLISLIRMVDEFSITELSRSKFPDDVSYIFHLWRLCRSMIRLLACKMTPEKKVMFKEKLKIAYSMINNISVGEKNEFVNNKQSFLAEEFVGEIFEDLINDMEQRGMLTYKKEDPMSAMGNFSD